MRVEDERARRPRHGKLTVDRRGRAGNHEQTRVAETAVLEHLDEMIRIAADVGGITREIGNGEQRREFADDRRFVMLAVSSRGASRANTRALR